MVDPWANFFLASAGAAAALTGLLFIAVSLRPREIRQSPLMIGRARSAFYSFSTIALIALLALAGTSSRLVGVAQLGVAIGAIGLSTPFTVAAIRAHRLNYPRAFVYHLGLIVLAVGGGVRMVDGDPQDASTVLAVGTLLLLGIALSNSWQLVLSHESDGRDVSP